MRPSPRSLYWDLAPSLELTQTNRADRQEILRRSSGSPEKQGWGAQSFSNLVSGLSCGKGASPPAHTPPQPLLTRSGTGWCRPPGLSYRSCQLQKRHVGYAGFVTRERVTPALHISAPNCSNAARKSAPEPSFPAYNRGSRRAALASAVPMSWQVFPQQGREDTSRAACTTSCAQKRATALHTRGWTVVAVVPQAGQLHQPGPSMMCTR